jgi:hypothetical protein
MMSQGRADKKVRGQLEPNNSNGPANARLPDWCDGIQALARTAHVHSSCCHSHLQNERPSRDDRTTDPNLSRMQSALPFPRVWCRKLSLHPRTRRGGKTYHKDRATSGHDPSPCGAHPHTNTFCACSSPVKFPSPAMCRFNALHCAKNQCLGARRGPRNLTVHSARARRGRKHENNALRTAPNEQNNASTKTIAAFCCYLDWREGFRWCFGAMQRDKHCTHTPPIVSPAAVVQHDYRPSCDHAKASCHIEWPSHGTCSTKFAQNITTRNENNQQPSCRTRGVIPNSIAYACARNAYATPSQQRL